MSFLTSIRKPLATATALIGLATLAGAQVLPWNQLFPATQPASRERAPAATDGTVVYLYGGQVGASTAGLDELWSFDGTTWTLQTPSGVGPGPRSGPGMTWDTATGTLVVFSGQGVGGTWGVQDAQTWEWSPTSGWAQLSPAVSPDPHWLFNMVYVPGLGSVFHGGTAWDAFGNSYVAQDTWAFDGINWTQIATTGPARSNGKLIYRPTTHDLLYFGGALAGGTKVSDTHIFDIATSTWAQVTTATVPESSAGTPGPGLVGPAGYFDPVANKTIIHGGQGAGPSAASNKTWEFNGTDWTDVTPAGAPIRRNLDAVWTPSLNRGIMPQGSNGSSASSETWERGVTAIGSFTVLGTGCPSQSGITPTLSSPAMPAINETLTVDFNNLSLGSATLAIVGTSNTSGYGGLPLPLPMGVILPGSGAGCSIQASDEIGIFTPAVAPFGMLTLSMPIPNIPGLIGLTAYVQGIQIEFAAGVTASNTAYAKVVVGAL